MVAARMHIRVVAANLDRLARFEAGGEAAARFAQFADPIFHHLLCHVPDLRSDFDRARGSWVEATRAERRGPVGEPEPPTNADGHDRAFDLRSLCAMV